MNQISTLSEESTFLIDSLVDLLLTQKITNIKVLKLESDQFHDNVIICTANSLIQMSSLIKTFNNNMIFHNNIINKKYNKNEIRFTKVLTKYSTEYNNSIFIQELCQKLNMDIKDMFAFFTELKITKTEDEIYNLLQQFEINKLDIKRIYKFIEVFNSN